MNPLFAREYVVLVTVLVAAVGGLLVWRTTAKCRNPVRVLMTIMRVIALACLGVTALNIGQWRYEKYGKESEWAVLVDRSASMTTADVDGKPRWDEAKRLVRKIKAAAGETVKTKVYTFTDQLEAAPVTDISTLAADGPTTDIIQAGRNILNRYRSGDRKLAGILLISDGRQIVPARQTDLGIACRSQEAPVFVMPVGGVVGRKDLSITAARRQYVSFIGQKLKIGAVVKNEGLGSISAEVLLASASGAVLATQKVDLVDGGSAAIQFEVLPDKRGYYEYNMKVPAWQGEDNENNNLAVTGVAVLKDKMRVFVAEGTPGWDSKFIVQLLRKQANMDVTSVYRLSADRFLTVEVDASKTSETKTSLFPDSADKMAMYDILVLGKGSEYFLNTARIALLGDFVREQGGCLIYSRGKSYSTRFPELEFLEPVSWGEPVAAPFYFQPTRAGESVGLFGDILPAPQDPLWKKMPQLQVANRCSGLKGFSQVLVEGVFQTAGRDVTFPLVVSQRYGKGMIVVMNAEGTWQWDFFPSSGDSSRIYKEMWMQLLQWGVTYSEFLPGQEYSMRLSEVSVLPDTPVYVRISRRGSPKAGAAPMVRVLQKEKAVQEIPAVPVADADNRWNTVLSFGKPGTYRVELAGISESGGGPCAVLQVKAPPSEKENLCADPAFLQKLAEDSGGGVVKEADLPIILKPVEQVVTTDVSKAVWTPLWDRGWVLVLILMCFSVEWFVRRRNGLM